MATSLGTQRIHLVAFALLALLLASVPLPANAEHASWQRSHARRSLDARAHHQAQRRGPEADPIPIMPGVAGIERELKGLERRALPLFEDVAPSGTDNSGSGSGSGSGTDGIGSLPIFPSAALPSSTPDGQENDTSRSNTSPSGDGNSNLLGANSDAGNSPNVSSPANAPDLSPVNTPSTDDGADSHSGVVLNSGDPSPTNPPTSRSVDSPSPSSQGSGGESDNDDDTLTTTVTKTETGASTPTSLPSGQTPSSDGAQDSPSGSPTASSSGSSPSCDQDSVPIVDTLGNTVCSVLNPKPSTAPSSDIAAAATTTDNADPSLGSAGNDNGPTSDATTSTGAAAATCDPLDLLCALTSTPTPTDATPSFPTTSDSNTDSVDSTGSAGSPTLSNSPIITSPPTSGNTSDVSSDSGSTTASDCGLLGLGCVLSPNTDSGSNSTTTTGSSTDSTDGAASTGSPTTEDSPASVATTTDASTTTSTDCGLLGLGCVLTPSSDSGPTSPTSAATTTDSTDSAGSPTTTDSLVSVTPTTDTNAATTTDCGLLGLGCVLSPTSDSGPTSPTAAATTDGTGLDTGTTATGPSQPTSGSPTSDIPTTTACGLSDPLCIQLPTSPPSLPSGLDNSTESGTQTLPDSPTGITDSGSATQTQSGTDNGSVTGTATDAQITTVSGGSSDAITFPSGTMTDSNSTSFSDLITVNVLPTYTSTDGEEAPTTFTTPSLSAQFSFLTASTLLISDVPTTTAASASATITDPDQATNSVFIPSSALTATNAAATQPPLPTDLPALIYPSSGGVSSDEDLDGYSVISIMFDTSLGWNFVSQNIQSAGQLLAYVPVILQAALSLSPDQVKTFALQVYKPATYTGPQDADQLRTVYIGFIPNMDVDILAQQIKALQSPFYTATSGIPFSIAKHVDASFAVDAVADPIGSSGNDGGASGSGQASSASSASNSRLDAIIGVCSALGGITLLIIVWLAYRNYKQRQELAHRRLSDPPVMLEQSPAPGQDFDRDSVGGNRRRSFYFAEDSLRGYAAQTTPQDDRGAGTSNSGMRERRTIVPGSISSPILRDNTLNW